MLANILLLVIDVAASFLTLMLLARFFMQWQRISFRNQLGQFVVSTTDWIVRRCAGFIPGLFGPRHGEPAARLAGSGTAGDVRVSLIGAAFSGNTAAVLAGLWGGPDRAAAHDDLPGVRGGAWAQRCCPLSLHAPWRAVAAPRSPRSSCARSGA